MTPRFSNNLGVCVYNPNEECILYTDAGKVGLGAVLKQKQANYMIWKNTEIY